MLSKWMLKHWRINIKQCRPANVEYIFSSFSRLTFAECTSLFFVLLSIHNRLLTLLTFASYEYEKRAQVCNATFIFLLCSWRCRVLFLAINFNENISHTLIFYCIQRVHFNAAYGWHTARYPSTQWHILRIQFKMDFVSCRFFFLSFFFFLCAMRKMKTNQKFVPLTPTTRNPYECERREMIRQKPVVLLFCERLKLCQERARHQWSHHCHWRVTTDGRDKQNGLQYKYK